MLNTDKGVREQLAIALDAWENEITSEFKWEKVDGEKLITGDNMLISDDEYVIRRQADGMETGYDTIELDLPEVGNIELYYIWDPS